jgi:hypothetical protein
LKLISDFKDFLKNTVNLNTTRIDTLADNVEALKAFVENSKWAPTIRRWSEQGSWAHETIIKPVDLGEFDADILAMVNPVEDWSAEDYVRELGDIFLASDRYKDKTEVFDYCVTITYAGEQKVDIAPCVVGREEQGVKEVCNKRADRFEVSKPDEYTRWLIDKNKITGLNSFRKATRLLKYMRDIKRKFTCSSVLLTTMLGYQVADDDKDTDAFADTPTTLQTLMQRLDDFLQNNPTKPRVENPHLDTEDFAAGLTTKKYRNLRKSIRRYRKWIDEAMTADGRDASVKAWRRVFGDQFAKEATEQASLTVQKDATGTSYRSILLSSGAHLSGLVDKVIQLGVGSLPALFTRPPYLEEPDLELDLDSELTVTVSATHHLTRQSEGTPITSGQQLFPGGELRFEPRDPSGRTLGAGFRVQWRVTNTGVEAFRRHAKRGQIYSSDWNYIKWEPLSFRGVHFVEAIVIRENDGMMVAMSDPFYVVIS